MRTLATVSNHRPSIPGDSSQFAFPRCGGMLQFKEHHASLARIGGNGVHAFASQF